MKARSWYTGENTKKMLPCVWAVAVVLSAPTLYVWDIDPTTFYNNVTSVTVVICADIGVSQSHRLYYAIYQFLVMFIIPVVVLFFCYTFVIHALWLSSRQLKQMTSHSNSGYSTVSTIEEPQRQHGGGGGGGGGGGCEGGGSVGAHSPGSQRHSHLRSRRSMVSRATREHSAEVFRARKQVIKMLITIILAFFLCWGPKLLLAILQRVGFQWMFSPQALNTKIILNLLPFVHSCLNPIIYGFMSKSFRTRMQCACRSYICRKTHPSLQQGRRLLAGSDYELETRSTNGTVHTVHTKISLRQASSSHSDT
ncbi:cholecystokinin receptor type A-like [Aplysia californica]|uniref:Cholecystokinin receptor type A-like n=1 Tax=Aplysia californica TaxID=6500 RepID=A0ABM0K7D0_APLCA|nr:cholecystokinin receptor type A-like [Aplysia californica]